MMPQTNYKIAKLNQLIWKEVVSVIRHKVKDPNISNIEITEAVISKDLYQAKIFFACNKSSIKQNIIGLNKAQGFIRSELAQRLQLRHTPKLIFQYDDTKDKITIIDNILHDIKHKKV